MTKADVICRWSWEYLITLIRGLKYFTSQHPLGCNQSHLPADNRRGTTNKTSGWCSAHFTRRRACICKCNACGSSFTIPLVNEESPICASAHLVYACLSWVEVWGTHGLLRLYSTALLLPKYFTILNMEHELDISI